MTEEYYDEDAPATRKPTSSRRTGQLSGVQVMFAAILAIGMVLGISLSSRIASNQPLRTFYAGVETEIAILRDEQSELIAERDFALSDAFVEDWARGDGKMVLPGEVLVVPMVDDNAAPVNVPEDDNDVFIEVETTLPEPDPWMLWWSLFFDSPPPEF